MTNDDWTKEIRERLEKATPGKCIGVKDNGLLIMERENNIDDIHQFHRKAPSDIVRLLEALEVMREALSLGASYHPVGKKSEYGPLQRVYKKALAWKPKGLEEKV